MAAGYPGLVGHHRHLLDDEARTEAFLRAIARVVRPGDVVGDLGTGSGILAFAARRAGARAVWAIDRDPIVTVAAAVARANGIDGITFVEGEARDAMPPELDVLVSECFGPFAIGGTMIRALTELRARARAKRTIPERIELFVAPVEDPAIARHIGAFARTRYGIDWSVAHALAINNVYNTVVAPRSLLVARPAALAAIDLQVAYTGSLTAQVEARATRRGRAHAIAGWFVAELGGGVTLSTAPGRPTTIWRQVVFPLAAPIPVERGTRIAITLRCHGGEHFDWSGTIGARAFAGSTRYSHPATLASRSPRADSSVDGDHKPITASAAASRRTSREP